MAQKHRPRTAMWVFGILLCLVQVPALFAAEKWNDRLTNGVIGNFPKWIHEALRHGADINGRNSKGEVALQVAIRMHNPDMVNLLLGLGADVNSKDSTGNTALHWAVYHQRDKTVKSLIERGAQVDARNASEMVPLHLAASYPAGRRFPYETTNKNGHVHPEIARLLLANGASVDVKAGSTMLGYTPLLVALSTGHKKTASLLLESGANPNAKDSRGFGALAIAAYSGDPYFIPLLLKYGAKPDQRGPKGLTPLMHAIGAGKAANSVALINGGANTNDLPKKYIDMIGRWRDNKNRTFVHVAACADDVAAINFCISQSLSLGRFDDDGRAPLHEAAACGSTETAARLLEAGVSVNRQQNGHDTPLIVAAEYGRKEISRLLLNNGGNPNLKGAGGRTALHAAAKGSLLTSFWLMTESEKDRNERESRYEHVIRLLLAAGAEQTIRDKNGMTAYEVALKHKNSKAAKILKP